MESGIAWRCSSMERWNVGHLRTQFLHKLDVISQINHELGLPTPELITLLIYYGGTD